MKFQYQQPIFLLLMVSVLLFFPPLQSEESTSSLKRWTLPELLSTALSNNPKTRIAWWNANRAAAAVGSARSAFYPQLALDVDFEHGREFQFTNGPKVSYTTFDADLVMTFLLADFGGRAANLEAEKMAYIAASWQVEWSIQKVMAQVLEFGYATIYAQEILEALQISEDDAKKMVDTATKLNKVGLTPISDVYSSKASLAQIQIDVAEQKARLKIERGKLASTLGFDADTPLAVAPLDALSLPQEKLSSLIAIAKDTRQDVMARRARVSEALALQKRTAAKYMPRLSFKAVGGADHSIHDKANAGNYRIVLNFEAPIFTGFDALYRNRMAAADVQISEENLTQLELEVALEVLTESCNVEAAKEMLHFAKINLDNAKAAYEGMLEMYNAGKERIAEVSIALRQIVTARVTYSRVSARYLISVANLAFAVGALLPPKEYRCIEK